jgi:ankyrin repeat and fibronectin type-III domain-containing protein 1
VDVNSLNSDGLSALDIAVLTNNRQMAKLLLQHGALPGPQSSDNLGNYLNSMIFDGEQKLHHLGGICDSAAAQLVSTRASFSSIIGSTSQSCTGTETERQMGVWERRIRGLRRLISGWQAIEIPDPPISFTIGIPRCMLFCARTNLNDKFLSSLASHSQMLSERIRSS